MKNPARLTILVSLLAFGCTDYELEKSEASESSASIRLGHSAFHEILLTDADGAGEIRSTDTYAAYGTDSGRGTAIAPVPLPVGATPTGLTCHLLREVAGAEAKVTLLRLDEAGQVVERIATVTADVTGTQYARFDAAVTTQPLRSEEDLALFAELSGAAEFDTQSRARLRRCDVRY